jgi:uncharacterized LabA/DUF88 family protein
MLLQNGGIPNLIKKTTLTENYRVIENEVVAEGNMSYVMMENTSRDLYECLQTLREYGSIENWREATDPSTYEEEGIVGIMASCKEMVEEFGSEKR